MRYILNSEGYIYDVSFGFEIECNLGTCTEYTGEVPTGYDTIEEWFDGESDRLNAWKIVEGNLVFDGNKYNELQNKWQIEEEENSCATKKYVNDKFKNTNTIYDDELSSQIEGSSLILIKNTKEAADIPEIYITPANESTEIKNSISIKITNDNMLKNKAITSTISGVSFDVDEDRSIILNGTATEDIEFILNGSFSNTDTLFFLKANQNYFKCGLSEKVLLNLYGNDGTDLELISSGSNGSLLFTNTKYITCVTLKITSGTKFNYETIFPMIRVGEYSSSTNYEYIECKENDLLTIDLQEYAFEIDDSISINRDEFTFNKHLFLVPSDDLLPDDELVPYDYFKDVLSGYVTSQISRENNTLIQCDKNVSMSVRYFSKDYLNNKFAEIEVSTNKIKLQVEEISTIDNTIEIEGTDVLHLTNTVASESGVKKLEITGFKLVPPLITDLAIQLTKEPPTSSSSGLFITLPITQTQDNISKLTIENNKAIVKYIGGEAETFENIVVPTFDSDTYISISREDNLTYTCSYYIENLMTSNFANKSSIEQTVNEINLEVSKKVGNNEVISKINQTAESVTIDANKININGTVSANGNFKVDTSGNMSCNNANIKGKIESSDGKIGGWTINSQGLSNGTVFIKNDGASTTYTVADLIVIRGYIMGLTGFELPQSMINHYDFNGDGKITAADYRTLQNLIGISMD